MTTAELLQKELGLKTIEELSKHLGFDASSSTYITRARLLMELEKIQGEGPTSHPKNGWMFG
jgi:hypothetical protein